MAELIGEFARAGLVNILGRLLWDDPTAYQGPSAESAKGVSPREIPRIEPLLRLSGLEPFTLTKDIPFVNVGERTNVTGSAKFRKLITSGDYAAALEVARDQVANGAQVIDVNMDEGLLDSKRAMVELPQSRRRRARHRARADHGRQLEVRGDRSRPQMPARQGRRQFDLDEGRRGQVSSTRRARSSATAPPSW